MTVLESSMLGGLTLKQDDVALPPIARKSARSLLAYLTFYRDRPHTRDLLAGTFWPNLPDAAARRRLSRALWEIRHALESSAEPIVVAGGAAI
jgi:DNA-binding SARP family transcriptional activator